MSRQEQSEQELAELLGSAEELGLLDTPPPFPLTHAVIDVTPDKTETAEAGDVRLRIGGDRVTVHRTRDGFLVEDHRDGHYYRTVGLSDRSPVMQALGRGEIGLLERASAGDDSGASRAYSAAVSVPLMAEMVRADDGPEEVILLQGAVAAFDLAGRAAARLNGELSCPSLGGSADSERWSRVVLNLMKAKAVALVALGQLRNMRRAADRRVRLVARAGDGAFVAVEDVPGHG